MAKGLKRCMRDAVLNPAWVCFTWFGLTAGVSVLATLAKFSAPSLSRPAAIDVGQVTFSALNKTEILMLVLLLILIRASGQAARWWYVGAVLALIVIAQSVWLLPELSERAAMIAAGTEPPASWLHGAYTSLELAKLGILFVTGFVALAGEK